MSWDVDARDGAVVVAMNSNPVNKMNHAFFDDLRKAICSLRRPVRPASSTLHALLQPAAHRAQATALARLKDKSKS